MKNRKTILITGGAGFIGSALVRYIVNNSKDRVVNIDKLSYSGNLESLASINHKNNYKFEQLDICNTIELQRVFEENKPDSVIHLAAESHVDRSIDDPMTFIKTNILGTATLLESSLKYWKMQKKKFSNLDPHY